MDNQHTDDKKRRADYKNSVAILVDGFLYELEKNLIITKGNTKDSDSFSGENIINADIEILNLNKFKEKIIEKAKEFGQQIPDEKEEWENVVCYLEVNGFSLKSEVEGLKNTITSYGTIGAGAAIGSVVPGVGTALGALIGLGVAAWRVQNRAKNRMNNNNQELENAKQKAIEQIRENRQKIIDAILAYNY